MTYTPSYTVENVRKLEQAIAQGVTSVSYDGKTVSYRNLDAMLQILDIMKRDLGLVAKPRRPRARRGVVNI